MKFILIMIVILVIAAVLLKKKSSGGQVVTKSPGAVKKVTAPVQKDPGAAAQYRSTSIKCGRDACAAAQAEAGKRFLMEQAPRLPLYACDVSTCNCTYDHHEDRRDDSVDRRSVSGLSTELYTDSGSPERRDDSQARGRRSRDGEA